MITQHFLKVLIIFLGMIFLGLIGVLVISYFEKGDADFIDVDSNIVEVAE